MQSSTIKNLLAYNLVFIGYLLSPNMSSFLGTLILIGLVYDSKCIGRYSQETLSKDHSGVFESINHLFNRFLTKDLIQQIAILVAFKFFVDLIWLMPSWLIIFIAIQVTALYGQLKALGYVQKISELTQQARNAFRKFAAKIPKYQGVKAE